MHFRVAERASALSFEREEEKGRTLLPIEQRVEDICFGPSEQCVFFIQRHPNLPLLPSVAHGLTQLNAGLPCSRRCSVLLVS